MLALLSVSDKRGLVPFARGLSALGFRLLSTGGTQDALKQEGVSVLSVAEHTRSPEILGGRVKTLHPKIHGGLLARLEREDDRAQLTEHGIEAISVLAVNLYPFRETVARGASEEETIEQIDVGGPAMLRAAAKNAAHVAVVVDPEDYPRVLDELKAVGRVGPELRRELQRKAFAHTAAYDAAIADYLSQRVGEPFPAELPLAFSRVQPLRYGENPHQRGALYRAWPPAAGPNVANASVLQGKELSYNNLLDLDSALGLMLELTERPGAVVIKHNNPCGVALADSLEQAYRAARAVDELSAFGGVVALNRSVDEATGAALAETFLEAVIAPGFSEAARARLAAKKNLRLLDVSSSWRSGQPYASRELRTVSGGLLIQDRDAVEPDSQWKVVTRRAPSDAERLAMQFAWRICKHVKSNAIVFASADRLLAAGGGQTSRVDAARIAAQRGGEKLKGSAAASDAFFPFRDGLDEVARAGATAVVQPGGSVRDDEVIAAADEHGLAMVFTGVRHFRH